MSGIQIVTPEGDAFVFTSAHFRLPPDCHTCPPTGTLGRCGSAGGSDGWSDAVVRSQRVARMLQIADQAIIVAGSPVQPGAFTGLAERHPQVEKTVLLEVEARRLLTTDFSRQQLSDFIRGVCAWGGYPGTAARVLGQNAWSDIQRQFGSAIAALSLDPPDVQSALRAVRRVRHLGLSFASKHLRLLRPDVCPVLDSTLSEKLGYPLDSRGYQRFSDDCQKVAALLQRLGVRNPLDRDGGKWFAADVEMALFVYVKERSRG